MEETIKKEMDDTTKRDMEHIRWVLDFVSKARVQELELQEKRIENLLRLVGHQRELIAVQELQIKQLGQKNND